LPQWEQDETPVPVHQEGSEQWSKSKEHPHLLLTSVPTARGCCEQPQLDGGAQECFEGSSQLLLYFLEAE